MQINLNLKIEADPRAPTQIVTQTSGNEKIIRFANGNEISESELSLWIQDHVIAELQILKHIKGSERHKGVKLSGDTI